MTARRWTSFCAIVFALFLVFEIWAIATGTPTLSRSVWMATDWFEPLALVGCFAFGLLCGHFWWPRRIVVRIDVTDEMAMACRDAFGVAFYDGANSNELRAWRAGVEAALSYEKLAPTPKRRSF